jgi:glycosyltransferase involved in cell wall biosynthesis
MTDLISICVTTYNRSHGLRVAVESILQQGHAEFEVVICDNASTCDTAVVASELCRFDSRIRYVRHPENMGPVRNFMSGLEHCRGRYFMWLADDDWLGENYLSTCLSFLKEHPEHALACGQIQYYKKGAYSHNGRVVNVEDEEPMRRVLNYYRQVGDNGTYYGLMRLEAVKNVPMRQVVGTDWFFVACMAFQGKIRSLDTTCIHRDYNWNESSFERVARDESIIGFDARNAYRCIAVEAFEDVLHHPVYASLSMVNVLVLP